jgi:Histone methylation protein DOT1
VSTYLRKIKTRLREHGLSGLLFHAAYRAREDFLLRRFGIRSAVKAARIKRSSAELGYSNEGCFPHEASTSFHAFRDLMRRFVAPGRDDVFLDYGSGTGTAMILAATFPFRKVIGVEYSAQLCAIAETIIPQVRDRLACRELELVNQDASLYEVPGDVSVIYCWNSFGGEILAGVCEKIRQSLTRTPRKLRIVYYMPSRFEAQVAGQGWLAKRAAVEYPHIYNYTFVVYESTPP